MFEAQLKDIDLLRDGLNSIGGLIDEVELKLKKDGIDLTASDRAVVAVVSFSISSKAFDSYKCDKNRTVGINLTTFLDVLKRVKGSEKVSFKLENNQMSITLENDSVRNFVLPLIEVSKEDIPDIEKLEFSSTIKMKTDLLARGVDDAELVTDSIFFNVSNDELVLKAESDNAAAEMILNKKSKGLVKMEYKEDVKARYSIDYLNKMMKAKKLSDTVTLSLASDYPMKLQFEVPDKVNLNFILAPRVEE